MRTKKEVIQQFKGWAAENDNVRAAVLTSTMASPEAHADFLSDYDTEMFVVDLAPFRTDDGWASPLGEIMTRWPYKPPSTDTDDWVSRLLLFTDGVRIDFQITDTRDVGGDSTDYGYEILVDKDSVCSAIAAPTYSVYNIEKPTREAYAEIVNEFWWNATYVAKYLWRDELPFAKMMMGQSVRDRFLRSVIEWYIGLKHSWNVTAGVSGRYFKRLLEPEIWREYETTFAGADIDESWDAFFNAIGLFSKLARIVGDRLGYSYPEEMESRMREYYSRIQTTDRAADMIPDHGVEGR